jgi:hypothetical protein
MSTMFCSNILLDFEKTPIVLPYLFRTKRAAYPENLIEIVVPYRGIPPAAINDFSAQSRDKVR